MKSISRDEVLRWVSGPKSQGGSGVGGGSVDFAGYATQIWTEQNYVGKEFFSSLFKAYDANGNEVLPNDTDTQIDNIKAMFGFWTEFYVSALGTGGQSTVGLRLAQLADVNVAGVTNGQVLTYDTTSGKWIASTPQSGTDMATVWANLAANGNQQINYSHLSGAVSLSNGTITIGSSSITPITSHQSLSGYAKEQWVSQNYLALTGGTLTGALKVLDIDIHNTNEINNTNGILYLQYRGGNGIVLCNNGANTHIGGLLSIVAGQRIYPNEGDLYIGNGSNAGWLMLQDVCSQASRGDGNWSIRTNGNAVFANVQSNGYVTALSDARHKNVQGDIALTVEMVAKAPAVKFTWKDEKKPGLFVGSLAQYWKQALPQVVQEQKDGTLSLDYQVTALMAAIVTARKVEDHEERLNRLERILSIKP